MTTIDRIIPRYPVSPDAPSFDIETVEVEGACSANEAAAPAQENFLDIATVPVFIDPWLALSIDDRGIILQSLILKLDQVRTLRISARRNGHFDMADQHERLIGSLVELVNRLS